MRITELIAELNASIKARYARTMHAVLRPKPEKYWASVVSYAAQSSWTSPTAKRIAWKQNLHQLECQYGLSGCTYYNSRCSKGYYPPFLEGL